MLRADGHDLYVRLRLPEETTLQAAPFSLLVLFDVDGDPTTGGVLADAPLDSDLGAELAVVFSPERGGRTPEGVSLRVLATPGTTGTLVDAKRSAFDFVFAPTYAAREFEFRLSRRPTDQPEIARALAAGRVEAHVVAMAEGAVLWSKPLGAVMLPPLEPRGPRLYAEIPKPATDVVRIVSWNVLFASPQKNPDPFARILLALDPDVVLLQEWDADAEDLERWFDAHLGGRWHALDASGWGVAIVARGELARLGPERVERPTAGSSKGRGSSKPLRVAAAVVETEHGPAVVASLHLKCCGSAGGPEDRTRRGEAARVRRMLVDALRGLGDDAPRFRVVGGDLNLVGSASPLAALRRGGGPEGTDLEVAAPAVLGDRSFHTWRGETSRFAPGRLDYLLYSGAERAEAFALETTRLADDVLQHAGLERGDSGVSDHLPLVLDLRPIADSSVRRPES